MRPYDRHREDMRIGLRRSRILCRVSLPLYFDYPKKNTRGEVIWSWFVICLCEAKTVRLRFFGDVTETTPFIWSGRNQVEVSKRAHVVKAALYAFQTFYAFMLM
jgi:hypothetical protein